MDAGFSQPPHPFAWSLLPAVWLLLMAKSSVCGVQFQFEECCPGLFTCCWLFSHCEKLQSHGGVEISSRPLTHPVELLALRNDGCCCRTLNWAQFCFFDVAWDGQFRPRERKGDRKLQPACHRRAHPSLGQTPEPCFGVNADRRVLLLWPRQFDSWWVATAASHDVLTLGGEKKQKSV